MNTIYLVLPPKSIDCTPYYINVTNGTLTEVYQESVGLNRTSVVLDENLRKIVIDGQARRLKRVYNYSNEYGRSVLTDVRFYLCILIRKMKFSRSLSIRCKRQR